MPINLQSIMYKIDMKKTSLFATSIYCIILFYACNNPKNSTARADSTIAITEAAPAAAKISIADKKWKLIELMGQPIADSVNGKEPFIMFKMSDSMYAANGGCNGLGGKFEINEQTLRIQIKQGKSKMIACPDMTVEDGLKKALSATDNYNVNDSILSLNKARMAPLARFKAAQ